MGHAAARPARHQGFHADIFGARRNRCSHHRGDQIVFGRSCLDGCHAGLHAAFGICAAGFDLFQLAWRLYHPDPFDQTGAVGNRTEAFEQRLVDRDGQEPAALVEGKAPGAQPCWSMVSRVTATGSALSG